MKDFNKTLALLLGLALAMPFNAQAQTKSMYHEGSLMDDPTADWHKQPSLNNRGAVSGWILSNQQFGSDAPIGSGIAILLACGAGYAVARRKRSRKNSNMTLLLVLAVMLTFTQCKKDDPIAPEGSGQKIHISLKVANGSRHDVTTGTGVVTYSNGDVIYVGNGSQYIGSITHDGTNFSGTVTVPDGTSKLYFYFVGGAPITPTTLSSGTTSYTVDISDQSSKLPVLSLGEAIYIGEGTYTCELKNKCGLVKFVPATATSAIVTLNGVYNKATIDFATPGITPTGATGNIALYSVGESEKWAILLPQSGATATATTGGITYAIESFPNITNNYYNNTGVNISSTVVFDPYYEPLTFEAMADGVTVKLHIFQTAQPTLQYSKNGGEWTTLTFVDKYNSTSISLDTGEKLSFKGDNTTLTENQNGYCRFECYGDCYVYGNIMSLLDKDNFPTNETLSAGFTFYELFLNAPIYNHPSKTLVLPATTLTASCYSDMFAGCTHLTTAPALPAATLAASCYNNMFRGCTGLTTAPTLSATTLASECYRNMFSGCTGLTTAPTLSATTLASGCYRGMFRGCTGLTTAPALSATTLASDCYHEMFYGCTGLTTAPNLPATTAAENGYRYMFYGCTALETAPALPATSMAAECYYAMFMGCTSMTTAPDLPATTLASYCYASMFRDCTGLTTAPTTLPATTLVENCYRSMFDGCTELTTAPILPAATLQYYCYAWMFDGCTKLNSVTCLATNISADHCTYYWLNGVAATGTFTAANSSVGWSTNSASGIPSGWTKVYPAPSVPSGAINGKFSVSSTKQVWFSQGNLQAVGTTSSSPSSGWTWQFAEHQWDYIGGRSDGGSEPQTGNNYISGNGTLSANGTVDLFGWSTNDTYYGIHNSYHPSTYSGDFRDWGNAIGSGWRTLTNAEWEWIMGPSASPSPGDNCRTSSTVDGVPNARYAKATVADKAGLIIFPDSYTHPGDVTAPASVNAADAVYTVNSYNATAWGKMEAAGAVFLPAAGSRSVVMNNSVQGCGVIGGYWSSVPHVGEPSNMAYSLSFQPSAIGPSVFNPITFGSSVRLVQDAN